MAMRILISSSDAERYLEELPAALRDRAFGQALEVAGTRMADRVKAGLPARTGRTRDSVFVEPIVEEGGLFRVEVFSNWFVSRFLEFGTRPHEIKPRKGGKALKIGDAFVASVEHPGMAARPVWHPEAERAFAGLEEDVANVVDQVLQER